ncbi:MAG: molybdenum cofactor biosynthesis protein B [Candidatus Acetothermia bacterium]
MSRSAMNHKNQTKSEIGCVIYTVSSSRTQSTDESGFLLADLLEEAGHRVEDREIISDKRDLIMSRLSEAIETSGIRVVIFTGGTGLSSRDLTPETVQESLDKLLPGFGELFRHLSFAEIGPRAFLSRALAGLKSDTLIFSIPGSPDAARLAAEKLIVPTIGHALFEIDKEGLAE